MGLPDKLGTIGDWGPLRPGTIYLRGLRHHDPFSLLQLNTPHKLGASET